MNLPPQHVPFIDDPDAPEGQLVSPVWYRALKGVSNAARSGESTDPTTVVGAAGFTIGTITAQWVTLQVASGKMPGRPQDVLQLTVPVTPPATIGEISGAHIYIENPDQSSGTALKLDGTTPLGTAVPVGSWTPIDMGTYAYPDAAPFVLNVRGANPGQQIRVYVQAATDVLDPAPVQAGLTGATPSALVTVPNFQPSKLGSGLEYEPLIKLTSVTALADDWSTGTRRTPIAVLVDTTSLPNPAPDNWACEVVLVWDNDPSPDPNAGKNIASGTFGVDEINLNNGILPAGQDGIAAAHTLALDTPASLIGLTVYVRSLKRIVSSSARTGTLETRERLLRNTIVPGVTPSAHITVGTFSGTVDIGAALSTSISSEFHIVTMPDGTKQIQMLNLDMSKASHLSSQFAFDSTLGVQKLAQIDAQIIITGFFQVGGGGGKPSQMKVFDTSTPAQLIGFIGDDSASSGYVGAWFKRCAIGGTSPATAKIVADSLGNVSISGSLIVGPVSQANVATVAAIFNGTIQASQVVAGQFSGLTMVLNKNGITSTFDNLPDPTGAGISGLKIKDNTTQTYMLLSPSSVVFMPLDPLTHINTAIAQLRVNTLGGSGDYEGNLIVQGTSGANFRSLSFRPGGGLVVTDTGVSGRGQTTVISYTKASGATGTLTYCMGWLIAQT